MKGYKGFSKGLICRNKQYAENTVFEEKKAEICRQGMHFCENPFDVLDYYSLLNDACEPNEFAEVEALADVKTDDNKKYCTTKLKIGAKLDFAGFVKACVGFVLEKAAKDAPDTASGYYSQLAASGADSVVAGIGIDNVAKASKGSWITLAEWEWSGEKGRYIPVCVKTERVDGEKIKADTLYKLVNGRFCEVD